MKQLYATIFLLFLILGNVGAARAGEVPRKLSSGGIYVVTATITASDNSVCLNSTSNTVTLNANGTTGAVSFQYKIGSGAPITVSGTPFVINVATNIPGAIVYTLISVTDASGVTAISQTATVTVNAPPTISFTHNAGANICSGVPIQFTSTVSGNAPYTYEWDFGNSETSSAANPSHALTSLGCGTVIMPISLKVTDANGCISTVTNSIQVKQRPDISFEDVNATGANNQFSNCQNASASNPVYSITVGNISSSSCIASYSINWGDSITENNASFPASHTYNQLGAYNMIITAIGTNGCSSSKTYVIKNVSNPSGGINSPGNTQNLCIPTAMIEFTISNWANNSPGTTYDVNYGDNTPNVTLTQQQLITSTYYNSANPSASANYPVPHSFTTNSCPNAQFTVTLTVTNACGFTVGTISNISTISKPLANFSAPVFACNASSVSYTNTTDQGFDTGCIRLTKFIWNFGDPIGSNNIINTGFTDLLSNQTHTFSGPGNYIVTLTAQNSCGLTTKTQNICIESPITPQFTVSNATGCAPFAVTTNNTTAPTNQCNTPTYLWQVSYLAANCGSGPVVIPNQTTANATYNFTVPGTYTITLTMSNSCGSFNATQTVTIKQPPTATINTINDLCGSGNITPTTVVNGCAPASDTLSYAWSFPGGTPATATTAVPGSIAYITSGSHTVSLVVTNSCGASATATKIFNVNNAPAITNTLLTQTTCSGSLTTPIVLTANPNTATFSWTAASTAGVTGFIASGNTATIPAQTLLAGSSVGTVTYHIIPALGSCTGTPVDYVITVNPAPTITTQPGSSTICQGGTPTLLTVAISSTSGTPAYQWYSNANNNTTSGTIITSATNATYAPPATVGTIYYYCVIALPASAGCASITTNTATVTVTPSATISTQPTPSQTVCVGASAMALSIAYTGGTGTAAYQWYTNNSASNTGGTIISGATNATYTPPVFNASGSYFYYAVVTLSGAGCGPIASNTANITVAADPIVNTQPLATQTLCQGVTPTALTVVASGDASIGTLNYQWYSNTTNSNASGTPIVGETTASFTPSTTVTGTFYYFCEVAQAAAGCGTNSQVAQIIVVAAPVITDQPDSSTLCLGGTPTVLSVTASSGVGTPTYQWYSSTSGTQNGTAISLATSANYTPPTTVVGEIWYYCIVTYPGSGGCSAIPSQSASVTVNAGATISSQPVPSQTICVGGTIATPLTVGYTGGTGTASWQWYSNITNTNTGGTAISGATSDTFIPSAVTIPGSYYFYAVLTLSGNGCGAISSNVAVIDVVSDPVFTAQPLASQTLCQNALPTILSVTATGGIGIFSYQWYSNTTNTTVAATLIPTATANTFTPPTATAGTAYYYCVISQSGLGCNATSNIAEVIINVSPSIGTQPVSSTICLGQTPTLLSVAFINGVGTAQYQWYSNAVNTNVGGTQVIGATNPNFAPPAATAGTIWYYCIITLTSGGCSNLISDVAEVTINQIPVISNKSAIICSGNVFTVTPVSAGSDIVPVGTTFTWGTPVVNPAGTIIGAVAETMLQNNISQTLTNTTINTATVTYTVTPLSGSCAGNTFTVTVTVNPAVSSNAVVNNSSCFGINNASIQTNITGGIPFTTGNPYQIVWTGPNSFTSNLPSISGIAPGLYHLSVTDAGGCPIVEDYTITEPADIIITTNLESDISCFAAADAAIDISVNGGTGSHTFAWKKDNFPFAITEDITNLSPGVYEVTVSDANNCGPKVQSYTVTEPTVLAVSLDNKTDVICYGAATGAININVVGGTQIQTAPGVFDYTYAWIGPNGFTANTQDLVNITAGIYTVTVTDNNGCTKNLVATITQPTEIIITAATTAIECYGDNNASISLTITGGNAPYQIGWSNLGSGTFQDNLSAGIYTITVIDATNCVKVLPVNIPEAPIFTINPIVQQISCFGANNGSITLNLVGGITPVSLVWNDNGNTGVQRNNLGPGTYTVTIIDSKPCVINRTFVILEPQPLVLSANLTNAFDCDNANSGAVNLLVSGGTPPFVYNWSNGAVTEDLTAIPAGNYLITVTDANGCSKTEQYAINRQPPLIANVITDTDFDCAAHFVKQTFIADVVGGVPPYQLSWSSGTVSGNNNEFMETNQEGTVILDVTDNLGCTTNYTFNVAIPVLGEPSWTADSFAYLTYGNYSIVDPIQFTSTATGDFESVAWDFGDGSFSTEVNPIHSYVREGEYIVTQTVTYPFGCIYKMTITILVDKGYALMIPNGFTPNKDIINDNFGPVYKGLKSVQLDVYDTWGAIIYSEKGETIKGWDGTIKGLESENGNYYYKITAETFYGQVINQNGPFTLIK